MVLVDGSLSGAGSAPFWMNSLSHRAALLVQRAHLPCSCAICCFSQAFSVLRRAEEGVGVCTARVPAAKRCFGNNCSLHAKNALWVCLFLPGVSCAGCVPQKASCLKCHWGAAAPMVCSTRQCPLVQHVFCPKGTLWCPRCFSFFRKRRCIYVHKQRAVGSGGVLQKCEGKSWKQLHLLMVPAREGGLRRELEVQFFWRV